MFRYIILSTAVFMLGFACAHPEKRGERFSQEACPICSQISNGSCSYCSGTGKCSFCAGKGVRTTKSHNRIDRTSIAPFSYTEPCPFCKGSGICTYCNGKGSCWACESTGSVEPSWKCLSSKETHH